MSSSPLEALLLEAAAALEGAVVSSTGEGHEVTAAGIVVAAFGADALEARLRPAVASAALRTPDTSPSERGRGWVRFAPAALDDFARDRALAWLESAVRLGAEADGSS
jgi:hypothetical protein